MEEQISESGQWPADQKRVSPVPPPIRPHVSEDIGEELKKEPEGDIGLRTLESDMKAIQESETVRQPQGESVPAPESVLPWELKEVFEQPETVGQLGGVQVESEKQPPRKILKIIVLIAGILIVGGGLGFLGYYVVYPWFNPPEVVEEMLSQTEEQQPVLPVRLSHKSYFVGVVPKEVISFRELNQTNISAALKKVVSEKIGILKEIEILDNTGGQIYFDAFISNFLQLTAADKNNLSSWLEPDFTAFLYYDANGIWPGYIAKVKSAEFLPKVKSDFLPIAELTDPTLFYLSSPGTFQAFKDGKVQNYATRYAVASQPGVAFNYGVFGDYAIFSTSYSGLKSAISLLGL